MRNIMNMRKRDKMKKDLSNLKGRGHHFCLYHKVILQHSMK